MTGKFSGKKTYKDGRPSKKDHKDRKNIPRNHLKSALELTNRPEESLEENDRNNQLFKRPLSTAQGIFHNHLKQTPTGVVSLVPHASSSFLSSLAGVGKQKSIHWFFQSVFLSIFRALLRSLKEMSISRTFPCMAKGNT